MATLQVGHYPINSNTADHAYAILSFNGAVYRFQCYGGTNDSGNQYPTNYYIPRSMWYTRDSARQSVPSLACHPEGAILLAQWGGGVDYARYDYNSKSGGYTGRGDCSGLTYALDGVCHQMCNTVTSATKMHDPINAFINWPPSLNSSKLIYGNRGIWGHEDAIIDYAGKILACYGDRSSLETPPPDEAGLQSMAPLEAALAEISLRKKDAMRNALTNGEPRQERAALVSGILPVGVDSAAVLEADAAIMALKNELDNLLIRGRVSHTEYAGQINRGLAKLVERYEGVLGAGVFEKTFEAAADEINCNIIDVAMMLPSYEIVKEALGI